MTDREKVIKGLECCIIRHPDDKARWDECPYESACCNRLKNDALALLKAQEPRLVTYEDFHSGREDGGEAIPCWKEARSKTRRSGWAVIVYGKMLADWEMGVARYWTARPTEEQMREEAWPGA
jgi:hypothetical protein